MIRGPRLAFLLPAKRASPLVPRFPQIASAKIEFACELSVRATSGTKVEVATEPSDTMDASGLAQTSALGEGVESSDFLSSLESSADEGNLPRVRVVEEGPKKKEGKKRRVKKLKDPALAPWHVDYPPRNFASRKFVGAHVSIAGGAHLAPHNALKIGAKAFGLFLKSQRQWVGKPLSEETVGTFPDRCSGAIVSTQWTYTDPGPHDPGSEPSEHGHPIERCLPGMRWRDLGDGKGFDRNRFIVPHGNYLVNLGNPDEEKRKKSLECFIDDLERAEALGIGLFNFQSAPWAPTQPPGSTVGQCTKEECISLIANSLNQAHKATKYVITLLENMAGHGNIIGSTFEEIGAIIKQVEDKGRVGCCLDTCHTFAAGYDLRSKETYEATMELFEKDVGFKYLKALHINDSKTDLGSHRDRHENIGLGYLSLPAFKLIMKDPRLDNLPFILETPTVDDTLKLADLPTSQANEDGNGAIWRREISLLHALERDDDDGAERLLGEIRALVKKGREVSDGRKAAKKERKMSKGKGNGKVKTGGVEDDDDLDQTEEEGSDAGKTEEDEGDKQEKPKGRRTPDRARGRSLPGKAGRTERSGRSYGSENHAGPQESTEDGDTEQRGEEARNRSRSSAWKGHEGQTR